MSLIRVEGDRPRTIPDRLPEYQVDAITRLYNLDTGKPLSQKEVPPNTVVMKKGDTGSIMYIILEGGASVDIGSGVVYIEGKGGFFGEMAALFERTTRVAQVTTQRISNTRVLELSTADVAGLALLDEYDAAYEIIAKTAASRAFNNLENNPEAAIASGIPSIEQWIETESGFRIPPLRPISPTRFGFLQLEDVPANNFGEVFMAPRNASPLSDRIRRRSTSPGSSGLLGPAGNR